MDASRTIGRSAARPGRPDIHFYVARPNRKCGPRPFERQSKSCSRSVSYSSPCRRPNVRPVRPPHRSSFLTCGLQLLHAFLESGRRDGLLIDPERCGHVLVPQERLSDGVVPTCDLDNDRAGSATSGVESLPPGALQALRHELTRYTSAVALDGWDDHAASRLWRSTGARCRSETPIPRVDSRSSNVTVRGGTRKPPD